MNYEDNDSVFQQHYFMVPIGIKNIKHIYLKELSYNVRSRVMKN